MPNVVVAGGVIQCSHGGQIQFSGGASQLQVSGSGAITFGMEGRLSFASGAPGVTSPCPQMTKPPPPATPVPSPCTSSAATAGVATLLTVGGAGVLLSSAQGSCANPADPNATWSIASPGETVLSVAS